MLWRGHMLLVILVVKKSWNISQKRITKNKSKRIQNRKAIKRKVDKLYIKWKGYVDSFNSCIDEKDIVI